MTLRTSHIAVDVFIESQLGLQRRGSQASKKFALHIEDMDRGETRPPAYFARKIRPDPKAIANYDALPRPKKPPGRT